MNERFSDRYPDDGGGNGGPYLHVPKEVFKATHTPRFIRAADRLMEIFSNADAEAANVALGEGDLDKFYAVLGISREEAEEIYDDLKSPLKETLQVELETFQERLPEFLETHPGEHVLIHKEDIGGFFPTQQDGISAGYAQYGNVPFLVQQILEEQPVIDVPPLGR